MFNKKLKNEIKTAYIDEAPDLLAKIKEGCDQITQTPGEYIVHKPKNGIILKRVLLACCCFMFMIAGIAIGLFIQTPSEYSNASIYLDVNPSIEIQLDNNDNVYKCLAVNEDAIEILNGIEVKGVKLNTALNAIVGSLYSNGYLSNESNSILVGINNDDALLLETVTKDMNNILSKNNNINCSIIGHSFSKNNDMERKAKEYGVSVSKMHLVDKIIKDNKMLNNNDMRDLSKMPIKDLNAMYYNNFNPNDNKDLVMGVPVDFINRQDALNRVMEYLQITNESIVEVHVFDYFIKEEFGPHKMVYLVQIRTNNNFLETYLVDSKTGEIIEHRNE